jgi:hypothetical protein
MFDVGLPARMSLEPDRLRRLRLAAQQLTPSSAAVDPRAAARAVVGVQAQDLHAARLALRSRVPGLRMSALDDPGLARTWTARGTAHLVDIEDLPWLQGVFGQRNRVRMDEQLAKRGGREIALAMVDDMLAVLSEHPQKRAALLDELAARGHPRLPSRAVNVFVPWAVAHGLIMGFPDGHLRPARQPPVVDDEDEALTTLARRYLAGYGPATEHDMASWSGLPLTVVRRAVSAVGEIERVGGLLALPGVLDSDPPAAPPVQLLAAFDTVMLGYRHRTPLVAAEHDRHVLPGGGMLRPVVLVDGAGAGTWRLDGSGQRRVLRVHSFGARPPATELRPRGAGRGAVPRPARRGGVGRLSASLRRCPAGRWSVGRPRRR